MAKARNNQRSSCPDGWLKASIKVPLHFTTRQEQYATRAVGIARSVFNLMVATHRAARAQVHGLWPSPMEQEKTFNERKNRQGTGSFLAASGVTPIKYDDHRRIRLPYLGSVKLKRELPEGIPYEVRIKKENGIWFASVNYWKPPVDAEEKTHLCGAVDVGIAPLAVDSELVHYDNPKALYRMLVRKYAVLAIESLNVAGMDQLRHQAKAIRDAAIGGLLQKIRYKADWYGTFVVEADRFYPSSKLCSDCGAHNAELGRELYWTCSQCGVQHDRNENATLNLLGLALDAARDLPKLVLGPVGPDVMLLDGKALAKGSNASGETSPIEGRTALLTQVSPAVDGVAVPYGGSRSEVVTNTQLQLAI